MKKLIPAIGMTLLGTALLGTSTYAWFSANKTVTATGLNISAKADSSLLICDTEKGTYSNTMSFANKITDANANFAPTQASYADGAYTFKALNADGKAFVKDDGSFDETAAGKKIDNFLEATTKDNYQDDVYLKFEAPEGAATTQDVVFSATLTGDGTENIFKAFRVSVVDPESKTVLYTFSFAEKGVEVKAQTGEAEKTDVKITLTANTPKQLEVYGWVDGNDTNCRNAYALKGNTYSVDLAFTIPAAK